MKEFQKTCIFLHTFRFVLSRNYFLLEKYAGDEI